MPPSPEIPLPLKRCINIVSALSLRLWAIAILFAPTFSDISSKNAYLSRLPHSSVPIFNSVDFFKISTNFT